MCGGGRCFLEERGVHEFVILKLILVLVYVAYDV